MCLFKCECGQYYCGYEAVSVSVSVIISVSVYLIEYKAEC